MLIGFAELSSNWTMDKEAMDALVHLTLNIVASWISLVLSDVV